ncbi:MAG: hypothetical protein ACKV22_08705 [Bryobacteraceae bacterium]
MPRAVAVLLAASMALPPIALSQSLKDATEFRARLLAPISTETSRKGDKITAQVISPAEFEGGILEGEVKESKSSGKMKGTSVLNFTFETLNYKGNATTVRSTISSMTNSKGKENVDEEGRVINKTNNIGKAAVATGAGAIIGGILGGAKGAAIGAGVGAAASIALIQFGTRGPSITFAQGSEFKLLVKEVDRK